MLTTGGMPILWRPSLAIGHACIVTQLTTNKAKEDAAIAWVMELELAAGRQPRDTRYTGRAG